MAFVYCNDRWKVNKENNYPGPGQYSSEKINVVDQASVSSKRLLNSIKKYQKKYKNERNSNQKQIKCLVDQNMFANQDNARSNERKSHGKRGKLYRNHSAELKNPQQKIQKHQNDLKILIKNAFHNLSNAGNRNKWGNMRIKQMLNEHRQKQLRRITKKNYLRQAKMANTQENRQKYNIQLKQLQNSFTVKRKGYIPKQFKKRQASNKFLAHNISEGYLRMSEPSLQELHIHPSTVYVTEFQQKYNQNQKCFTSGTCSIGVSHLGKQKSIQTGLQDDSFQENSIQYISDATPGPGAYNVHLEKSKMSSKIGKFGVTMQRFKPQKPSGQIVLSPKYPDYKISTYAKQEDVGFGRSTKEHQMPTLQVNNPNFYEDYNTLQYKSLKMQNKRRKQNICFDSSKQRFTQKSKQQVLLTQSQDSQIEYQYEEQQVKPTSNFLSKVNRQLYSNNLTQQIDFTGQNAYCIANKLKRQKQHGEDYDLKPAPFLTNSKRFVYKEVKPEQKKQQLLGIKIEQLKKKKTLKKKQITQGYTFCKQIKKEIAVNQTNEIPSPVHYDKKINWIKTSYNIKFNP